VREDGGAGKRVLEGRRYFNVSKLILYMVMHKFLALRGNRSKRKNAKNIPGKNG
jgi:ABC-type nitrate/sulfonate/bicarbonate transport system permease component